jgi:ABC-type branched-subunit amino acid transport system ATPase component
MMRVRNLHAGYGRSQVLQGVDLDLHPGEIVALLGRNGAGRTTLARALMGLVGWRGELHWNGRSLAGVPTHLLARLGGRPGVEQGIRLGWGSRRAQRLERLVHGVGGTDGRACCACA